MYRRWFQRSVTSPRRRGPTVCWRNTSVSGVPRTDLRTGSCNHPRSSSPPSQFTLKRSPGYIFFFYIFCLFCFLFKIHVRYFSLSLFLSLICSPLFNSTLQRSPLSLNFACSFRWKGTRFTFHETDRFWNIGRAREKRDWPESRWSLIGRELVLRELDTVMWLIVFAAEAQPKKPPPR